MDRRVKRRRLNPKDASESEDELRERYSKTISTVINESASELSVAESGSEDDGSSSEQDSNEDSADGSEEDSDEYGDSEQDDIIQEGISCKFDRAKSHRTRRY
jgi:hypothetical protein